MQAHLLSHTGEQLADKTAAVSLLLFLFADGLLSGAYHGERGGGTLLSCPKFCAVTAKRASNAQKNLRKRLPSWSLISNSALVGCAQMSPVSFLPSLPSPFLPLMVDRFQFFEWTRHEYGIYRYWAFFRFLLSTSHSTFILCRHLEKKTLKARANAEYCIANLDW